MVVARGGAIGLWDDNVMKSHHAESSQKMIEMNRQRHKGVRKFNGWRKLEKLEM
jgi:hypothetical protein